MIVFSSKKKLPWLKTISNLYERHMTWHNQNFHELGVFHVIALVVTRTVQVHCRYCGERRNVESSWRLWIDFKNGDCQKIWNKVSYLVSIVIKTFPLMMREMMSVDLSAIVNTNIYLLTTLEELERYRDYLDGI